MCQAHGRDTLQRVARQCATYSEVVAVDVLAPAQTPSSRWTVEIVVEGKSVPPRVLAAVAVADVTLDVGASGTRGEPMHAVVVGHLG
ncbi:hypothetical protein H5V44_01765 [Halobellus sp. MBLA0160]|uniref:Uncharacterized protein n=2 Tax=Halobellus ruber TaxID=2761102 RepID=A0A7J9SE79_9EURY|nr:hypothetical protein [Halobellus ruber]